MAKIKEKKETPLMKQYNSIKAKHPDAMLLFRVGDFYETFGQDAIKAAEILGIVLTARNNGASKIELAGFPHHSLNSYLPKLVRSGLRVAVCDQLEVPSKEKKIVKRGVTELVTPGVTLNDEILEHKSNNFLASIHQEKKEYGVSFLDVSTGEFLVGQGSKEYMDKLLHGFKPSEVLVQRNKRTQFIADFGGQFHVHCLDDWAFTCDYGQESLQKQFGTKGLKGFGIDNMPVAIAAAGASLYYLSETQHDKTKHISAISRIEEEKYVWLDRFTIRNLELIYSPNENGKTLIDVLDKTITAMGARLLKRWVTLPLKDLKPIQERLDVVEELVNNADLADEIRLEIKEVGDLERIASKVTTTRINPREVIQLKRSLLALEPIKQKCLTSKNKALNKLAKDIEVCSKLTDKITTTVEDEAPVAVQKGNVIKAGVSKDLDELRGILNSGKDALQGIQEREIEQTGIPSLKIAFNNVFGYYIEVRNTHKDKVPESWHRKQTLTQAERYITEELKEYESKILGADEKILALETRLFNELVLDMSDYLHALQLNGHLVGRLDCLLSFAAIANENHYSKPKLNERNVIEIKDGRHPVIEQQLPPGEEYVSNDIYLDDKTQQIMMITGPNMSGKSAILRQTALITLMAQIGCFVPAKHAEIGLVDKIFTRVGASDNISQGESTFMVEMNETASILNNLSNRSLILLDEIGRGTSTYDGISIAWSIAEHLHEHPKAKAKTLFATHYHELNDMTTQFDRIKNYNVSVKEIDNKIIFLRKLEKGGSNHSFGIHVAKMAGMPSSLIGRANEVLKKLESAHVGRAKPSKRKGNVTDVDDMQLSFFQLDDPVLEQIKDELINIDIENLTPVEALMKLNEIKKAVGG